ncbi:18685_t:CDS:2, partial [Racocetra persica]
LASNKKAFKKSNKSVIKEIIKKDKVKTENNEKDTVKTENNENTTLLQNSKEVSSGKQDMECDKNSDQAEEKPISASKKRKRSDPGHAKASKASLDNRSQNNSKLEPEYRLDIKKQWEIARRKNITPEERNKSISRLFEMVRGNVPGLLFKNDTSRVIETCLKYGTKEQRNIIASELEGHLLEASKN